MSCPGCNNECDCNTGGIDGVDNTQESHHSPPALTGEAKEAAYEASVQRRLMADDAYNQITSRRLMVEDLWWSETCQKVPHVGPDGKQIGEQLENPCKDWAFAQIMVAIFAAIISFILTIFIHTRCVEPHPMFYLGEKSKKVDVQQFQSSMKSLNLPAGSVEGEAKGKERRTGLMMFVDFIMCLIIPVVVVYAVWFLQGILASVIFAESFDTYVHPGETQFSKIDSIGKFWHTLGLLDITKCTWTLFPTIVAIWLAEFLMLAYFYVFVDKEIVRYVDAASPTFEVNQRQEELPVAYADQHAWWRAGGASPLSMFFR